MSLPSTDPYKALGVDNDADISAIKTAYRKLVLKCHPDKVQDPTLKAIKQDEFQRVQQAYEILGDETKRKEYDDDVKLKKLRDELSRTVPRPSATATAARSSSKGYTEFNVRTAEPPPGFKPGPPPSPFSPYAANGKQFSHSWDRDMPYRTKAMYDEHRHARRTASYERPRDDSKERRPRKEEDEPQPREWARDKERERDRDKKSRADRERDEKRDKQRREMEKRERERDRIRRQDQQEKYRTRKPVYVEPYDEPDDDHPAVKKKQPPSSGNNKKYADSVRRDKTSHRDESPRSESNPDKTTEKMKYAADYMDNARRRGSKSGTTSSAHMSEGFPYNPHFPDPEEAWQVPSTPRPRRSSQDEKYRTRVDITEDEGDGFIDPSEPRPPRLTKSYTSPAGAMHISNSSAPRVPHFSRATTMDYSRHPPPVAPVAPSPESGRHSSKSERRHRGAFDVYDDEVHPRRPSAQSRVLHYPPPDEFSPVPRTAKHSRYKSSDDFYHYPVGGGATGRVGFNKVKTTPSFSADQVYQSKKYSDDDVLYSTVNHSSNQYSSPHASYLPV